MHTVDMLSHVLTSTPLPYKKPCVLNTKNVMLSHVYIPFHLPYRNSTSMIKVDISPVKFFETCNPSPHKTRGWEYDRSWYGAIFCFFLTTPTKQHVESMTNVDMLSHVFQNSSRIPPPLPCKTMRWSTKLTCQNLSKMLPPPALQDYALRILWKQWQHGAL